MGYGIRLRQCGGRSAQQRDHLTERWRTLIIIKNWKRNYYCNLSQQRGHRQQIWSCKNLADDTVIKVVGTIHQMTRMRQVVDTLLAQRHCNVRLVVVQGTDTLHQQEHG